jgi:hypothetical protein
MKYFLRKKLPLLDLVLKSVSILDRESQMKIFKSLLIKKLIHMEIRIFIVTFC